MKHLSSLCLLFIYFSLTHFFLFPSVCVFLSFQRLLVFVFCLPAFVYCVFACVFSTLSFPPPPRLICPVSKLPLPQLSPRSIVSVFLFPPPIPLSVVVKFRTDVPALIQFQESPVGTDTCRDRQVQHLSCTGGNCSPGGGGGGEGAGGAPWL